MGLKLIVACGGTGGHAFPGLAAAKELSGRGHDVTVWMSGRDVEASVLKGWEGPVFATGARQLSLKNAFSNLRAIFRCSKEMRRAKPDAVLAMGSYSSLPPVLAAAGCKVPVVLHEANTVPGRAVDFLSSLAKVVAVTFEETSRHFPRKETVLTGLPVRTDIAGCPRFAEVPEGAFCVFVTGGSQGAHRLNEIASKAMPLFAKELSKTGKQLYVIHQTGAKDEAWVREFYGNAGIAARVNAFEHEMGSALSSADVVVARAGASTCFELALTGRPAFLVPLPTSMRDHQHYNADAFASRLAAAEGVQSVLTPGALAKWLLHKAEHADSLEKMSENMKLMSIPDAASRVANLVERVAKGK
ncbi:MAG: UDP-N-acetylglucosamine--N-acetylmuramyl-(pentapeptide) pyrophosphoryl-undecaprenol N-acetylglucosamine transferase [Kiritimatiellae bacterium]|nr:UDP-N-acetylglucosamine--N-acetylmuramyl-(pentapeptide) pyrophosphoryl-undecaprenol N-acetylglucosamine transferase [Kiritimatiellia bacterium]